ncbi:MAG: glycosyltransferase [Patescibacteria group bacterium]
MSFFLLLFFCLNSLNILLFAFLFHDFLFVIIFLVLILFFLKKQAKNLLLIPVRNNIKYVCGWAIKSLLNKSKIYVRRKINYSKNILPYLLIRLTTNIYFFRKKVIQRIKSIRRFFLVLSVNKKIREKKETIVKPGKIKKETAEKETFSVTPTLIEKPGIKSSSTKNIFPIKKNGLWRVTELTPPADIEHDRLLAPSEFGSGQRPNFRQRAFRLIKESLFTFRPSKKAIVIFLIVLGLGVFSFGPLRQIEDKFISRPTLTEQGVKEPQKGEEGSVLGEKKTSEEKTNISAKTPLSFGQMLGQLLAGIALIFGLFFFVYSLKYYLTIILVMLASQSISQGHKMGRVSSFFYRLFFKDANNGNGNGHNGAVGLLPNYQDDKPLTSYPFVSVQLPFYNEKKVVNRILTACTSFDYPNYEVVVADDSTDETLEILKQWQGHPRVKILHRENRAGFKGAALREAMKIQDKRTEFVIVFDADFIPYPDTIKQFLKYFLVNGNGNGNGNGIHSYKDTNVAAVQGYQWHVLNKNENWITRSVRTEFSGSYVIERPGIELMGGLKQIAGSVYMIRADVLSAYNWTDSITEDFELTLRIYRDGWKVIFTPYIQAPAECVSTIKRLIRQRMRWAEGHTNNVRRYFWSMLKSPYMSRREKAEFLYLAPYYLQSAFLLIGTTAWFISDVILHAQLPFWTSLWGWSLVFVNLFALPLLNSIGLFFEESTERDYLGAFSFVALCYILAPFQALAAIRGLFKKEGGWFRTPKSGHITDLYFRSKYRRWFKSLFPGKRKKGIKETRPNTQYLKLATSHSTFQDFKVKRRKGSRKIANVISLLLVLATLALQFISAGVPIQNNINPENLRAVQTKFLALDQGQNQDNTFETSGVKEIAKASVITSTGQTNGQKEKTSGQKNETVDSSALTPPAGNKNTPVPDQTNLPSPEKGNLDTIPVMDENNPNTINTPSGPALIKDSLPEKVKLAVKTAYADWPEGEEEIELQTLRTQKSKQILTSEGQIRQEIGDAPLHYADAEGNWQDISTEIKPVEGFQITSADTYQYANTTNNFQTYFKADEANPEYVKFEYKGKEISFSLPAAVSSETKPTLENNIITYPEVYPDVDLRYTIYLDSVLEEYIVKNREALASLPILAQEFNAENTAFAQEEDKLQFRDNLAGTKLWHFPKPVVYELNNQDARNYGLHREVENLGDKFLSKKILDQESIDWLNSSDRQFPVVIDDSTVVDYSDTNYLDGHVKYDGSTYTTVDTDPVLIGQNTTPDPDEKYRGFIKFDITDLNDSTTYNLVGLYVRSYNAQASGGYVDYTALPNDPNGRGASDIYADIGGATVYYNNITSFRSATDITLNLGATAVSNLNSALAGNWFGVGFKSDAESADWTSFRSEEYATTAQRPRLGAIYDVITSGTGRYLDNIRRSSFYDQTNGKYWVIMCNRATSTGYGYYSSDDGATWTEDTANSVASCNFIDIWYDDAANKVYAVYATTSYDTAVNVGTVNASSITWGGASTAHDGSSTDYTGFESITRDADGYCWVAGRRYTGSNYYAAAVKSTNTGCTTWAADTTDISDANSNANNNWPEILPISSDGDVYAIWSDTAYIHGRRWDDSGSTWNAIDENIAATLSNNAGTKPSGVVDSNYDLHLIYTDDGLDLSYKKYDESAASWGSALETYTGTALTVGASLDTSTNEIYASALSWDTQWDSKVYYKKCDLDNDCTVIGNWTPNTAGSINSTTGRFNLGYINFSYKASGRVWVITGELSTYSVDIQHIVIPEAVWFFIPVIPFLPKLVRKLKNSKGRRSARGGKKKRKFSKLFSVFGIRKRK